MKKSVMVSVAAMAAALLMSGCTKKTNGTENAKKIKIGVIQLVEHSALDANYKGFVDGLAEAGYVDGKNIKIDLN